MNKQTQMHNLIQSLKADTLHEEIKGRRAGIDTDLGLINHYKLLEVIPNKWFDWKRRSNAEIVIIGQDWGPYSALLKFVERYNSQKVQPDFDYDKFLFETFSSRTEKFIMTAITQTYLEAKGKPIDKTMWDNIMFTMAVLFTRQGKHFRGNHNFDPEKSRVLSYPYVKKQLEIVKPKVIIPLGNLALTTVNEIYNLGLKSLKIGETTKQLQPSGYISINDTYILPNFHPAAHVDPKVQLGIWRKLWELL